MVLIAMLYGEQPVTVTTSVTSGMLPSSRSSSPRLETPTRLTLDGMANHSDNDPQVLLFLLDATTDGTQNALSLATKAARTGTTISTGEAAAASRRISSSLSASSEIVMSLFGESVGPCWGDFFCTHLCIRGRLYATSEAVLFYTNLLGFERRICLLLRDVVDMHLYRTTSIRIHTSDLETYIFKSFNDREQVLHLLNGLKILSQKAAQTENKNCTRKGSSDDVGPRPSFSSQNSGSATAETRALMQISESSTNSTTAGLSHSSPPRSSAFTTTTQAGLQFSLPPLPSPPMSPFNNNKATSNRRRAASDSIIRLPPENTGASFSSAFHMCRLEPIESSEELTSCGLDPDRLSPPEDEQQPEPSAAWAQMKQVVFPQLQEVGLEDLVLPCSTEEYYKMFLADDARYPLDYYQKEYVKDKNVEITGWDISSYDAPMDCFCRTITFTHPIKNSMGIGPSSAQTTRQQRLRKFPGLGMAVENRTFVEGLPGADCFFVQDLWLLEPVPGNDQRVKLSVHYDVKFKKRSLFRNIITKSVKKETKEWIAGYVDMVQSVLVKQDDGASVTLPAAPEKSKLTHSRPVFLEDDRVSQLVSKLDRANRTIMLLLVLLILSLGFFSYQVMNMNQCMLGIQSELHALAVHQKQDQNLKQRLLLCQEQLQTRQEECSS